MARRYALVIGISEYQSPLKPLSKPASDAEAVAVVLKKHGDFQEVTVLKGAVTSAKLIQALRTLLLEQATQNDVLLYFTGHGIPVVDPVVGKPRAYLATSDSAIALEGKQVIEARRAVPLDSLNDLIQESQLSSLVMLFDSCHSGDFLERSLVEKTFTAFSTHKDYYLITACRGFEQAYAIKREQHSILTGALLVGLSQANANEDGQVTGDRLFESVARELRGSGQEPLRMGYGGLITLMNHQPQLTRLTAIVDAAGEPICPYQGLQAFTEEQQAFFFGRQRTVEDIRRRLEQQPFVPVIGASGSGKSSVVRAGLMPWLAATGWQILDPIKPGFDPLAALRAVVEPFFPRSNRDIQQLHQLIKTDPDPLPALVKRLSDATTTAVQERPERFLLVVDQFEEVFTLCPDEGDRQRFIDLLTQVVNLPDARLAAVITMRADFLEPCLRYPALHQLIEAQAKYLASPTGIDLRDAIVEPAKRQGYSVEESLLFKIQGDVGKEPGFLPLLEFALTKLWEQRDTEQKLLTLAQYENLGGLTGALNLHAEQVYHFRDFERDTPTDPRTAQEQAWIKRIFLRLVRTGEAEKDTRQRRPKSELLAIADVDLDAQGLLRGLLEDDGGLVQGRLLVTGQEQANSVSWVDLAHEALLDGWTQFAEWRKGDREVRRLADRIHDDFKVWRIHNCDNNFLISGGLLTQIHKSRLDLELYLSCEEMEFYQLSYKYQLHQTSYEQEVNQVKEQLRSLQKKVVNKMNQTVDNATDLAEFNQELNNYVEELQVFEVRRKSSQLMAEWLIENQKDLAEIIYRYIFSHITGSNETSFRFQELNRYFSWLYNSLLAMQPRDTELEPPSSVPAILYAQAFDFLRQELPAEEPSRDAKEEFDLYLEYLISYFNSLT
jgi:energy-coupling factor transporter ATP-binding protein EcfA2